MFGYRLPAICAAALIVAGCGKPGDRLVGTWTGSTYSKEHGGMQVTVTFKRDGTEKVTTVILGKDLARPEPKPPVESAGTYTVKEQTLVQDLDPSYAGGEALATDSAAGRRRIVCQWAVDERKLTLSQAGVLTPCILAKIE